MASTKPHIHEHPSQPQKRKGEHISPPSGYPSPKRVFSDESLLQQQEMEVDKDMATAHALQGAVTPTRSDTDNPISDESGPGKGSETLWDSQNLTRRSIQEARKTNGSATNEVKNENPKPDPKPKDSDPKPDLEPKNENLKPKDAKPKGEADPKPKDEADPKPKDEADPKPKGEADPKPKDEADPKPKKEDPKLDHKPNKEADPKLADPKLKDTKPDVKPKNEDPKTDVNPDANENSKHQLETEFNKNADGGITENNDVAKDGRVTVSMNWGKI